MVIDRLVHLLPREYQGVLPARAGAGKWRPPKDVEESEADQAETIFAGG
jgi:hypothetical protein